MIDERDKVTIIGFGSCAAIDQGSNAESINADSVHIDETYGAPEYKLGRKMTIKSDMFSLAVIFYEMLTGRHPYGPRLFAASQSTNEFYRLKYQPAHDHNSMVPVWMDGALKKATSISPELRYDSFSDFINDLDRPNKEFIEKSHVPLNKQNPLRFWRTLCALLVILELITLWCWLGG